MKSFTDLFIRRPVIAVVISLVIVIAGLQAIRGLTVRQFPKSENASITEYFDKVGPEPNGDIVLLVRTVVEDPKYLQVPFITSTHFKLEKDGAKWNPSPCKIDPPVEVPAKP